MVRALRMRWLLLFLLAPSVALAQTTTLPPSVNYSAPTTGSVSASATIVSVPGNKVTKVCNTTAAGGGNIWLNPAGGTATTSSGDEATAGGGCVIYTGAVKNQTGNIITGISDSGTATYTVTVGN